MIPKVDEGTAKTANKYPLVFIVFVLSSILSIAIDRIFFKEDSRNDDCQEQVVYLRDELKATNATLNEYVKAILFKDAQIKNRDLALDSLKKEKEVIQ